jgi:protein O-GlcNAc transferase
MKPGKDSKDLLERARNLHGGGQAKEAESLYRQVISRNAQNHQALYGYGSLLLETGRVEDSIRHLQRAVSVEPHPLYLTKLGEIYRRLGALDVAAESFGRILEIEPDFPDARLNLAITVSEAGMFAEAMSLLQEAAASGPDSARLRIALSSLFLRFKQPEQALVHARRAVELAPEIAATHRQLGDTLDASGEKAPAIESYRRAVELNPSDYRAHSDLIVAMLSSPGHDDRERFAEARAWAQRHAEPLRSQVRPFAHDKQPERRLRIGYVSPDLRAHALQQFLVPLLEHHDPEVCEVFLYSSVSRPDAESEWYRAFAGGRFRDILRMSDVEAAELIRQDGIDILIDLALHSVGGRLRIFACRPAPVQITWLGYAGTTGLDTIDYRITDPFVDPPEGDATVYSETCLHLPETSWGYAALVSEPEVAPLPALGNGFVTFGSQNTFRKLHEGVFAVWARVLCAVPGSRLLLCAEDDERERVRRAFTRAGVSVDRLEFAPRVSRRDYLERFQRIDIGLDTWPFNGATTTLDSTWMGVPVVTLTGPAVLQRAGACIASNLGLPELLARSEEEFVEKASVLAGDLPRLSELRRGLRARLEASPLGDLPRFVRNVEAAYRTAWRRFCADSTV